MHLRLVGHELPLWSALQLLQLVQESCKSHLAVADARARSDSSIEGNRFTLVFDLEHALKVFGPGESRNVDGRTETGADHANAQGAVRAGEITGAQAPGKLARALNEVGSSATF